MKTAARVKARAPYVEIDGSSLSLEDIGEILEHSSARVTLRPSALEKTRKHRAFLLEKARSEAIYGVNTGFGPMVTHIIGAAQTTELQQNLLRGHAMGIGIPIDERYVLSSMIVRLNTLMKGYSGVSIELVETLAACINHRIIPVVPEHGAVGTSGDLVQLAHIALPLIGEGEVTYHGIRSNARDVLKKLRISPHAIGPKEGLSLINGTSVMSGIGSVLVPHAERALAIAIRAGTLAFELVHGFTDVIDPVLHRSRPHKGQEYVAKTMRELSKDSKLLSNREAAARLVKIKEDTHITDRLLQEVYSLRCIPQVLGPIRDTIERARTVVETEINSVTDNPIVDLAGERFLHGGNFHGDYVATAMDQVKAGLVKMGIMEERRLNFFLNKNINREFPPFLNLKKPGLTMGLQGLQFVATSTVAQSQSLGYPHSLHSISTNGDNQDIVSMGTDAALLAAKVLDNTLIILSIELVALSQAVKALGFEGELSSASRMLVQKVRKFVPPVVDDRSLTREIESLKTHIAHDKELDVS